VDLVLAFIVATVAWILVGLWEIPVSYGLERLFTRYPLELGRQLRGLTFTIIAAPISALTFEGGAKLFGALNLRPLIQLADAPWAIRHPTLTIWMAVGIGLIGSDFLYYWTHRAQHAVPFLWRFHSMHHSTTDLSGLNSYAHWTEEAVQLAFKILPMALIIQSGTGMPGAIAGAVLVLHQRYIHSTSRLNLGPWSWLINDNRRHRIHHSVQPEHFDKNFSIMFGFWDHLFGTAYVPRPGEWPATGLNDQPEPETIWQFWIWSFAPNRKPGRNPELVSEETT
jgi:sterol desaturase/sphingolipid hydroxylase (fatty acid hydroxylase superfamily)